MNQLTERGIYAFLSDLTWRQIVNLSKTPALLEKYLLQNYADLSYPRDLEPDSQIAAEAADYKTEQQDEAETRVKQLQARSPGTWENVVRPVLEKLATPYNLALEYLEGIDVMLESNWDEELYGPEPKERLAEEDEEE